MSINQVVSCIACCGTDTLFNIFDTHECEGIEEIYIEMLKNCFSISISEDAVINHMCEKCILMLRQAYYFKQNILKNLEDFEKKDSIKVNTQTEHQHKDQKKYIIWERLPDEKNKRQIEKPEHHEKVRDNHDKIPQDKNKECNVKNSKKKRGNVINETRSGSSDEDGTKETHYECADCNKRFSTKLAIARHMKTHLSGPFPCHVCDQVFTKLNSRNSHIWRVHQSEAPYSCSECGARFTTFHKRLQHLLAAHGKRTEYPCPYCDNMYYYAGARTQHIRATHLRESRHRCELCQMAFFKLNALRYHMATKHDIGEKEYKCPICNKRFYKKTVLRYHMKRHEDRNDNDKKYQCTICSAKFTYKVVLKNHVKSHEMELGNSAQHLQDADADNVVEDATQQQFDDVEYLEINYKD